jgi:hypothetical protein
MEDPFIIQLNIAHYCAMLKLDMDAKKRSVIRRLLAEAEANLALANDLKKAAIAPDTGTRTTLQTRNQDQPTASCGADGDDA